MAELNNDSASAAAGIDLSQFYQIFFEEAGENLDTMEQMLLTLDIENADDEELNAIFRCAHSVKGGAATFGFGDVAELTHQMETLLDKLRRRELAPTAPMVDVLLASGDALKAQLGRHQGNGRAPVDTSELLTAIRRLVNGNAPVAAVKRVEVVAAPATLPASLSTPAASVSRWLELTVGPLPDPAAADNLVELFQEISNLGTIEALDAGRDADGMRRFKVETTSSDNDLIDLFSFHVAREHVRLAPLSAGYGFHAGAPGAPEYTPEHVAEASNPGYGFFDDAPGAPSAAFASIVADSPIDAPGPAALKAAPAARAEKAPAAPESSTLRVSVEKVDQLINLVGELVITQAMPFCASKWPVAWPTWNATRATCRKP